MNDKNDNGLKTNSYTQWNMNMTIGMAMAVAFISLIIGIGIGQYYLSNSTAVINKYDV